MDKENGNAEEKTASALQVNELFLSKILARNDSHMDNSTVISSRRSVGGVPFKWESQPGTPMRQHLIPRKEIAVPPVSPPPASSCSSPGFDVPCNTDMSRESRTWFWKKSKKNSESNKKAKAKPEGIIGFENYHRSSSCTSLRSSPSTSSDKTTSRLRSFAKMFVKWKS